MRRNTALLALTVGLLAAPTSRPAAGADAPLRIGVVAADAALAREFAAGVDLAVAESNDAKLAGAKRPSVETLTLSVDAHATAAAAVDKAAKEKCAGVVACTTESVGVDLEAAARKAKLPLVIVGPGGAARTLDANDPVFRVEPCAAERGLEIAEWLRLKSAKASVGLPAATKKAWLVVEDAAWAKAVAAALRADDVDGLVGPGDQIVRADAAIAAADVEKARTSDCDRVVVVGDAKTTSAVIAALDAAACDLPVLALDTAIDGASTTKHHAAFVAATPTWNDERKLDEIASRHGRTTPLTPTAARAYAAAASLIEATLAAGKRNVALALRDVHEGATATEWPLFDPTGQTDKWRWTVWVSGQDEPFGPVKPSFVPDARFGPFLGGGLARRYRELDGAVCVVVGYGGGAGRPTRTVEADLETLGMGDGSSKAAETAREQILARTCAKLSRVWGRNRDGSSKPLGFKIAFVADGTSTKGASVTWDAVCAGDDPDGAHHGGIAFPGKNPHCQAFSSYLIRHAAALQTGKLSPPLSDADLPYLDGRYAWNTSPAENLRADQIRALLEGVASTYCMKLSKELGHLAGLDLDKSGDPRSVMVTKGGEGTADEFAYFPAYDVKILEKTLGRVGAEGK